MIAPENLPAVSPCGFGIPEPEQRFVLDGISWDQYEAIGNALEDRANLRMTYDDGRLEFMSKSLQHGRIGYLLATLVAILLEEANINSGGVGEITLRDQKVAKALEPDHCFYTANFERIRGKDRLVLPDDPPPDLAIEVDVTNSSLNRMAVYEALKVPEVWRWTGQTIRVYQLNVLGTYDEYSQSMAFLPGCPVMEFLPFLEIGRMEGDNKMKRAFRTWAIRWLEVRGLLS